MNAPRSSDERTLHALALKQAGHRWRDVARLAGFPSLGACQQACLAVRKADLAESGEPESVVRAGYEGAR